METNTADLEAKTADRGNKFDIVDTKPVDHDIEFVSTVSGFGFQVSRIGFHGGQFYYQ